MPAGRAEENVVYWGQQELMLARAGSLRLPMDGDVFIAMVVNIDGDDVALARVDGWTGELPVHGEYALPLAEPGVVSFLYLQAKFCLGLV